MNLKESRAAALKAAQDVIDQAKADGRDLTADELSFVDQKHDEVRALDEKLAKSKATLDAIAGNGDATATLSGQKAAWAAQVASRVSETMGAYGVKAITTGGIDIPQALSPIVTTPAISPGRVLDLFSRAELTGNEFEYLRQTTRTNNAATVADNAAKPTSVYTFEDESGRARVFAHLSEPIPLRYLADHRELSGILSGQMGEDLYRRLEANVLVGDGVGENFTGIANTSGIQTQAYDTSVLTTLRKARTALETIGETPTAWVMSYADLETIDMQLDGNNNFMEGIDQKVFGGLPKIASLNVPAGTAYLADWRQARIYVRELGRLDADASGDLFDKNQVKLRYEGRFGFAVLRPAAFVEIDLTAV